MLISRKPLVLAGLALLGCVAFSLAAFSEVQADELKEDRKTEAAPKATEDTETKLSAAIDREIAKLWERDGIKPGAQSSDEEFLRRVYIDTVGMPPSPDEVVAFLKDESTDKRSVLIDKLVDDRRFGEHIADQWLDIMIGRGKGGKDDGMILGIWLADEINAGRGFDEVIYEIISASGTMADNPPVAYYSSKKNLMTQDVAGEAAKHFTGVQIQCAQCHDHPYEENWHVADFNGVAAFFWPLRVNRNGKAQPRLGVVSDRKGKPVPFKDVEKKIKSSTPDQLPTLLKSARFQAPKYLEGAEAGIKDARNWRSGWAKWVVSKDNTQTQRYLANRFWSFLFGMGLQNPVDDFNSFNEPSHPELLNLLAVDLRDHDYDIKRLYRAVLKSRTWQLSSDEVKGAELWHFANHPVRQLSPEQFFAALLNVQSAAQRGRAVKSGGGNPYTKMRRQAEGKDPRTKDKKIEYDLDSIKKLEAIYATGSEEWFVRRSASRNFASYTEDDEMIEADAFSLTIDQALLLMNGKETNFLSDWSRGSVLDTVVSAHKDDAARIEQLYLIVLSRRPTAIETKRMLDYAKESKGSEGAWEDILFSLLVSSEFSTNH